MRILLVEDDQRTAEFIIKGLKQAAYVVEHCADGLQGYKMATEQMFDAAILDIMLPGMDGLSILRKLRARESQLPVIILSAKKEVDERVNGLQAGADDYLVKPFSFSELLARVQTICRRHQPEISSRYLKNCRSVYRHSEPPRDSKWTAPRSAAQGICTAGVSGSQQRAYRL